MVPEMSVATGSISVHENKYPTAGDERSKRPGGNLMAYQLGYLQVISMREIAWNRARGLSHHSQSYPMLTFEQQLQQSAQYIRLTETDTALDGLRAAQLRSTDAAICLFDFCFAF